MYSQRNGIIFRLDRKRIALYAPIMHGNMIRKAIVYLIPQAPDVEIPRKAKTPTYYCQEKFGLVWVALKNPEFDLPNIPEYENTDWKLVNTGPFNWNSDSSRQVENFTDFGHFPWVHPGLLGDPERPKVPDCKVTIKDSVLHYSVVRPEATNSDDFPIFANEEVVKPERRSVYELHLPYTIVLRLGWGGNKGMVYFFTSQPISHNKCRGFCIVGRNYNHNDPDTVLQDFEQVIFDQDKRVVESQRPQQVPFDFSRGTSFKIRCCCHELPKSNEKTKIGLLKKHGINFIIKI